MDTFAFGFALFLHIIFFAIAFGAVAVVDSAGLLWMVKKRTVRLGSVLRVADITQPLIWIGFLGLIGSGTFMQIQIGHVGEATVLKLGLVLAAGVNGFVLHRLKKALSRLDPDLSFSDLGPVLFQLMLATTVSQVSWWGAAVIGFLHAYERAAVPLPLGPEIILPLFYGVWVVLGLIVTIRPTTMWRNA